MKSVEEQLVDLQTRFAFQEDNLQQLNDIITQQQQQIEILEKELLLHREKLGEVAEVLSERKALMVADNEIPPHY